VWPPSALESLRAQVRQIEGQHRRVSTALAFGVPAVDSRLPGGALPLGALHEIAGGGNGAIDGAAAALFAAGIAARTRGKVLWCLTRLDLFAPALAQAGLNSDRVIYLCRHTSSSDNADVSYFNAVWMGRSFEKVHVI